jgi:hypothetical protein
MVSLMDKRPCGISGSWLLVGICASCRRCPDAPIGARLDRVFLTGPLGSRQETIPVPLFRQCISVGGAFIITATPPESPFWTRQSGRTHD